MIREARMASLSGSIGTARTSLRLLFKFLARAVGLTLFIVALFVAASPVLRHWFVVPVAVCGCLIGADAVAWLRGRLSLFDPVGIVGILGYHFFFLAPLLHVYWDRWMKYVVGPEDWRPWLGWMACLNAVGLVVYRVTRSISAARGRGCARVWRVKTKPFFALLAIAMVSAALAQVYAYARLGGLSGYVQAYADRTTAFEGLGRVFSLAESLPVLAILGYAVYVHHRRLSPSWSSIVAVLVMFFFVKMLFGGLRGSRSNTVWALFWATGAIHFYVRPVSRRAVAIGIALLIAFMYFYGFYKGAGLGVARALEGPSAWRELEADTGRTLEGTLLGDMGRADVQALVLYKILDSSGSHIAFGRTYLGAMALLVPRSVWPDRPDTKVLEGTDLLYGDGAFASGQRSSRVYGLAGEAMLNFGPPFVLVAYAIFGWLVGSVQRLLKSTAPSDSRRLLLPALTNLCFIVMVGDSDNVFGFCFGTVAIPALVLLASSARYRISVRERRCRT